LIYPDFKYVDVAVNGAHNRNKVHMIDVLGDPTGLKDTYMTYFRYDAEMLEYFKGNVKKTQYGKLYNSVNGFEGRVYSDWIPIDIDSGDLQTAQDETIRLTEKLKAYDVDTDSCRFYFSGSKGFHVLIPSEMVGVEPGSDTNKKIKKLVIGLAADIKIDTAIYDKVRLFRLPNTINTKSGLYKIGLYSFEIINMPISEILELAKNPREELDVEEDIDLNEYLNELYLQEPTSTIRATGTTEGVKAYICMKNLMQGVSSGNRDNVGVRVASHLKRSGLSKEMMSSALNSWNDLNDPPLETYELERIFRQGLSNYEFGCNDDILKANCDINCIFYKGAK